MSDKRARPVFNPEGMRRLLAEDGGQDLNDDERALLLALIDADTATGRELTDEEHAALDKLRGQVGDYDADELARAVQYMVDSKPHESRQIKWPDLHRPASGHEQGE